MDMSEYALNISLSGIEGRLMHSQGDKEVNDPQKEKKVKGSFQIPVDELSLLVIGTRFSRKNHSHYLELTGQNLFSSSYLSVWPFNGEGSVAIYTPLEERIQRVESLSRVFKESPKFLHVQEGESITYYLNHYGSNYPSIKLSVTKQP